MKRYEEKVPGFDEIIFENRNKDYGAYDLRKRYKSAISFSILGALAFSIVIVISLSMMPKAVTGPDHSGVMVIADLDDYIPELIKQPEAKLPSELRKLTQNLAPEVVTDSSVVTSFILSTEEIINLTTDRDVNDTLIAITTIPEEVVTVVEEPFIVVEEPPMFPGGDPALLAYIAGNIIYPQEAIENNIQGRVILKFVVTKDGSIGTIQILSGVDPVLDQEAIRVVSNLPRFKPGKQAGMCVPVWYSVPVLFKIAN
jgi:protein TonB